MKKGQKMSQEIYDRKSRYSLWCWEHLSEKVMQLDCEHNGKLVHRMEIGCYRVIPEKIVY